MKEAFQNVADREKQQVIEYLREVLDALIYYPEDKSDEILLIELLIDRIKEKQLGKPLEFRYRDIGL